MKNRYQILSLCLASMMTSTFAQADVKIYGKIHLSADVVDIGAGGGHGLSSNASRIGFKGKEDLSYGLKGLWKIESEIDMSSQSEKLSSRNRYLGLNYGKSTLVGGYHDTPFKTIGKKIDVFPDTVADRRGVLGMDYVTDSTYDVRAENAVMFVNKSIDGLEFRFMRAAGAPNASAGDKTPITSTSLLYKTSQYMIGGAYEIKEASTDRTAGLRLLGGVAFSSTRLTAIYEQLDVGDSNVRPGWGRSVFGLSVIHKVKMTSYKAQLFIANALNNVKDSGSRMIALGAYHKLSKPFEIYAVFARLENQDNAAYTLTGDNHGDVYRPSGVGANMHSVSFGGIYKF